MAGVDSAADTQSKFDEFSTTGYANIPLVQDFAVSVSAFYNTWQRAIALDAPPHVIALLESFGFVVQVEQELNVRYTTATVRSSVLSVESFAREHVADPATKRVPSFFQRGKQPDPALAISVKRPVVPSEPTHVSSGSE